MAYQTPLPDINTYPYTTRLAGYQDPLAEALLGKNGILGFLSNQEDLIKQRRKQEILNELTRGDSRVENAIDAQNEDRDLRKETLNNRYFVDAQDEDLNKAIDNLYIDRDNRIKTEYQKAVDAAINKDAYAAGNSDKILQNLGYLNVKKGVLSDLGKYDQEALNKRYKDEILQKIADNQIVTGRLSPDEANNIIDPYINKYGMNIDRSYYMNPDNLKNAQDTAINARVADMYAALQSGNMSLDQFKTFARNMAGVSNEVRDRMEKVIADGESYVSDLHTSQLSRMLDILSRDKNYGGDYSKIIPDLAAAAMQYNIPAEDLAKFLKNHVDTQNMSVEALTKMLFGDLNAKQDKINQNIKDLDEKNKDIVNNLNNEGVKVETEGIINVQNKISNILSKNKNTYSHVADLASTDEGKQKILGFIWKSNSVDEANANKLTEKTIQSSLERLNNYLGNKKSAQKEQNDLDSKKIYAGSIFNRAAGNWSDILNP